MPKQKKTPPLVPGQCEWLGTRFTSPFYVMEPRPHRPQMALWMESPSLYLLHHQLGGPTEEASEGGLDFGQSLLDALAKPLIGPLRQPDRIRVESEELAAEVRRVLGDRIPVLVAPTPEFREVRAALATLPSEEQGGIKPSYFEGGELTPALLERFFRAAAALYKLAPWKHIFDEELLGLDIEALGVREARVSVIGNLDQALGLVIFASEAAFEEYLRRIEELSPSGEFDEVDLGTTVLALDYCRGAELPASMRAEVAKNHWPVVNAHAYPVATRREPDGFGLPVTENELRQLTGCAEALAALLQEEGGDAQEKLSRWAGQPFTYTDEEGLKISITIDADDVRFMRDLATLFRDSAQLKLGAAVAKSKAKSKPKAKPKSKPKAKPKSKPKSKSKPKPKARAKSTSKAGPSVKTRSK